MYYFVVHIHCCSYDLWKYYYYIYEVLYIGFIMATLDLTVSDPKISKSRSQNFEILLQINGDR